VGWVVGTDKIRQHINALSEVRIGKWFDFCIKFLTPLVLLFMLVSSIIKDIRVPYEGYPQWALNIGWAIVILLPVAAFILSKFKTVKSGAAEDEDV